jgi:uncharacterized protein (DUF433 family)
MAKSSIHHYVAGPPANDDIEATPGFIGGKPRIAGRRIGVQRIVEDHLMLGMTIERIMDAYDLAPAQVHAALAYYYDHQAEIDQLILDDEDALGEVILRERDQPEDEISTKLRELRASYALGPDEYITVTEITEHYGITPRAVREAAAKGWVPARKSGATWLIRRRDAESRWGKK